MSQQNLRLYKCSVCGRYLYKKIFSRGGLQGYVWKGYSYHVCMNCGTVCLNPRLDEKGLEKYYQTQYYGKSQPAVLVNKKYDHIGSNSRGANIFNDLQKYVSKATKILEIGCGQGENLIIFQKNGFNNLTGLEISSDCCNRLQNFYDINCVNCSLERYVVDSVNGEEFDCIILSHVLEHFAEPEKALEMISSIMEHNGVMYIRVPNLFGFSHPYSQFGRSHTVYFSKVSLQALLNNCGLKVDRYFGSPANEIALIARNSNQEIIFTTSNTEEYERVLSYLNKHRLEYARNTIMTIFARLIFKVFGERVYIIIRASLRKLRLY